MTTYLELTNELLRRLNEVELTASNFDSARNIQASAKDFIKASIDEINNKEHEWPYNYVSGTQVLTIATEFYPFPEDAQTIDWMSFAIVKDPALNTFTRPLQYIKRDEWYKQLRARDEDNTPQGVQLPMWVFQGPGRTYGVSPGSNQAYTIKYDYFRVPNVLTIYSDVCVIPPRFNYVIIAGALKHFYMFKDNTEQAQTADAVFGKFLAQMQTTLMNRQENITDTRINFGGRIHRSAFSYD